MKQMDGWGEEVLVCLMKPFGRDEIEEDDEVGRRETVERKGMSFTRELGSP